MGRADVNKVKMFASRKVDRARPAYGRHRIDRPRRCIFIGSTNDDEYLKDTTGNRRFWPFTPGDIDVEALRRDRDQLWAEAVSIEASGEELFIPEELWPEVQERQQSRMSSHPWEDRLLNLTAIHGATVLRVTNESGEEEWRVGSDYILTTLLNIPVDRLNEGHAKTLKGVMRKLGWTGPTKLRIWRHGGSGISQIMQGMIVCPSTFDGVPRSTKIRGTAITPKSIHPDYKHMEHVEQEVLRCFIGISSFHAFPGDGPPDMNHRWRFQTCVQLV